MCEQLSVAKKNVLPILYTDFLSHFHVLVDIAHQLLVNTDSYSLTPLQHGPSDIALYITAPTDSYSTSTRRTQKFYDQNFLKCPPFVLDGIHYHIKKTDLPVFPRFRRLAPDHLAAAKQTFARMEEMGLCQRASSTWSSLLRIVLKKDGSLPPCGDYRRLSMQKKLDHYPIPNITDVTTNLHKAKVFFILDILKGYYQVPMNPGYIPRSPTITTPFSTYTFKYLCHLCIMFDRLQHIGLEVRYK
ncbi:uncharacterized protein [Palaemon carinicauda]|uniref:uncharacterized protein n=1 Tax=Palaemon carinicauda TaxID=392227 RepID=UPI0035B5E8C3